MGRRARVPRVEGMAAGKARVNRAVPPQCPGLLKTPQEPGSSQQKPAPLRPLLRQATAPIGSVPENKTQGSDKFQ